MSVIAPDPTLDFLGLYVDQTEDVILSRLIDWANEGLDPTIDAGAWVDTREGGHWRTCIMPVVREFARLYDLAGSEVPMSGIVLWSWGTYLDDLAAVWDVARFAATPATGSLVFSGPNGTVISAGVTVSAAPSTPDDPVAEFTVIADVTIAAGTADASIQAREPGIAGNVGADAITAPVTPLPGGVTFTNPDPTTGGTDPESDDHLRGRLLAATAGKGPGAVRDYIRWATDWGGVGSVKVVPLWDGPGTVMVMVADPNGLPVATGIVTSLQNDLDPVAGKGEGTAPVGATVTVDTSTVLNITLAGHLDYELGYSWDGFGNTVAVGPDAQAAIVAYLLTIPPGGEVVLSQVQGLLATTRGVHDVTGLTLNGAAANVAVGLSPPQTPQLVPFTPT